MLATSSLRGYSPANACYKGPVEHNLSHHLLKNLMVIIQFRRILLHDLLRNLHRILPVEMARPDWLLRVLLHVLFGWTLYKQVLYIARARRALVDGESRGELLVSADLNCVEHGHSEVLAVIADQVVGGALGAHSVDYHFACEGDD